MTREQKARWILAQTRYWQLRAAYNRTPHPVLQGEIAEAYKAMRAIVREVEEAETDEALEAAHERDRARFAAD